MNRRKYIAFFISFTFFLNILMPYPYLFSLSAEEKISSKRTLAVMAFTPPISDYDKELIGVASKRVSRTKKFYLVQDEYTNEFTLKLFEHGDKRTQQLFKEAQAFLEAGKNQYDKLQFKEAVDSLQLALKKYRKAFPYIKDATDVLRNLICLGMAYVSMGDLENGKNYIMDMLRMDPERKKRKLSKSQFPPNIRAIYQARQEDINKQRGGKIIVVSFPPNATLYLNGFKVGDISGSYVIDDLPPGEHFVMVEKAGYSRFFQEVELWQKDVTVNAVMDKWSPFSQVSYESLDESKRAFFKDAATELGADVLLLGSIETLSENKYLILGQLFDSKTGDFSKIEKEKFGDVDKSPKYFREVVTNLLKDSLTAKNEVILFSREKLVSAIPPKEEKKEQKKPMKEEKEGGSIFSKWWLWGAIGGTVVVIGSVFLFTDIGKGNPNYNVIRIRQ